MFDFLAHPQPGLVVPVGSSPRYGIGYQSLIFAGKTLSNSASGSMSSVLAGMNWAISARCQMALKTRAR